MNSVSENEAFAIIPRHDEKEMRGAEQKELVDNWDKFGIYEEVQDCGQLTLSVHWVVTEKILSN